MQHHVDPAAKISEWDYCPLLGIGSEECERIERQLEALTESEQTAPWMVAEAAKDQPRTVAGSLAAWTLLGISSEECERVEDQIEGLAAEQPESIPSRALTVSIGTVTRPAKPNRKRLRIAWYVDAAAIAAGILLAITLGTLQSNDPREPAGPPVVASTFIPPVAANLVPDTAPMSQEPVVLETSQPEPTPQRSHARNRAAAPFVAVGPRRMFVPPQTRHAGKVEVAVMEVPNVLIQPDMSALDLDLPQAELPEFRRKRHWLVRFAAALAVPFRNNVSN